MTYKNIFVFLQQKGIFLQIKCARACICKKFVVYLHDFWNNKTQIKQKTWQMSRI